MEKDWEEEEEEGQHIWSIIVKTLWTLLVVAVVFGALISLTVLLGWWNFVLLCVLGLLTGIALTAAILISPNSRNLVALLLGVLTLPALAAYLGSVAAKNPAAFSAQSTRFMPFLTYAVGTIAVGLATAKIWRKRPVAEEEEAAPEVSALTSLEAQEVTMGKAAS